MCQPPAVQCRAIAVCVASLAACGRFDFTDNPDAPRPDTAIDAAPLGRWGAPQPLTILNTPMDDSDPDLRGDGLEIVFHSLRTGGLGNYDLYHATRASTDVGFDAPTPLSTLETAGTEGWPSFTGDGLTLLFSDGNDIFYATRPSLTADFGPRIALPELSSADSDTTPDISRDGLVAMVTRGVTDTREIWMYTRSADGPPNVGWGPAVQLTELSSPVTDASPDMDDHGLTVYFHSDRLGTTDDIYVATRASTADPFDPPSIVSEVTTNQDEGDPSISSNQRIIVFHRNLDLMMATR